MKLQLNHMEAAFLRRSGLAWPESEDPATTPTASTEFKLSTETSTKKRRTVHFDEEKNQEYANTVLSREECANLWYSGGELNAFKQQTRALARDIRHKETNNSDDEEPHSFRKTYTTVYHQCCRAKSDNDVTCLTGPATCSSLDLSTVGMERRAITSIAHEVMSRRRHITDEVLYWQETPMLVSAELRERMMAEVSCLRSRASRLYAQYTALVSAAMEMRVSDEQ